MSDAIKFLRDKEWSMGNGQCPECCGVPESWIGHPLYLDATRVGHRKGCSLAKALAALGEVPLMVGQSKRADVHETFWTPEGFLSTRPKAAP